MTMTSTAKPVALALACALVGLGFALTAIIKTGVAEQHAWVAPAQAAAASQAAPDRPLTTEQRCARIRRTFEEVKEKLIRDDDELAPRVKAMKTMSKQNAKLVANDIFNSGMRSEKLIQFVIDTPDCYSAE